MPHNSPFQLPTSYSGHPNFTPEQISGGQIGNDQGFPSFSLSAPSTIASHSNSAISSYQKDKRANPETF